MTIQEFITAKNIFIGEYDGVFDIVDKAQSLQMKYPARPTKPTLPKNPTSADYIKMGKLMECYETDYKEYTEICNDIELYNSNINGLIEDFIRAESGLNELPVSEKIKAKIYDKAWADGHSSGFMEVYYKLVALVNMLTE